MSEWRLIKTAPENWADVLLYDENYEDDWRKVFEGYYDGEIRCWYDARGIEVNPSHWMPLPEPPQLPAKEA
jgi:hypothetical protein